MAHSAPVDEDDAIGSGRHPRIVCHDEDRRAGTGTDADHLDHGVDRSRVEPVGRFVEQRDVRRLDGDPGQCDPAPLATRQTLGQFVGPVGESDTTKGVVDHVSRGPLAADAMEEFDVLPDRQSRQEVVPLEEEGDVVSPDPRTACGVERLDVATEDVDATRRTVL